MIYDGMGWLEVAQLGYRKPILIGTAEYKEDLSSFKFIIRHLEKSATCKVKRRMVVNATVLLTNSFEEQNVVHSLILLCPDKNKHLLKALLQYLNKLPEGYMQDTHPDHSYRTELERM